MIRVAVVEDEKCEQENIRVQLEKYKSCKAISLTVDYYEDGADFVENFQNQYDIVLCDIQMKFMGGIEMAEQVRRKNSRVIIIFITNRAEFSIQGYEVEASGYILKPLSYPVLERHLDRAMKHIPAEQTSYLVIEGAKNVLRIPVDEICYIECVRHYQYIHTTAETYRVLTPLWELEEKLDKNAFVRCNNGCLIHLKHVQKLERNMLSVGQGVLNISRNRKKEFVAALTEYMTNNM